LPEPDSTLRDSLALARTDLANERTLLAYLRTAIMLLSSGGAVLKLFGDQRAWLLGGWSLVGIGCLVALFGAARFARMRQRWHTRAADKPR
jgi:putative membrane protein